VKASKFKPPKGEKVAAIKGPTLGELVGPVKPLPPAPRRVSPVVPKRAPPRIHAPISWGAGAAPAFAVGDDGELIEGARPGQEASLHELKRGHLPAVATLDLHGLFAAEAEKKLLHFCDRQRGARRRAVLVVHGRGTHSRGGRAVLRNEIAAWLSTPPLSHAVLCFATAKPRDGGAGALYILLAPR
jgi:DNA-nicking Smr family endonuclease